MRQSQGVFGGYMLFNGFIFLGFEMTELEIFKKK